MPLRYPFSMQLYSGRLFPPLESQLAIIVANGYDNVETYGPLHDDPVATRRLLDAHGLTAKSGHIALDLLETRFDDSLEVARILGFEFVVAPHLPLPRPYEIEDWKAIGARLARISERFAKHGLRFAWHNHDFEFQLLEDRSHPIEYLLGDSLLWEADLAWVHRGIADPAYWLQRYRGRIPLVHVKDCGRPAQYMDEGAWADVGAGILGWEALWPRCVAAGAEIMIAEHDLPSDFERFARVSADAMRRYARGTGG